MTEQPHDFVSFGYGWADSFGEPVEPVEWGAIDRRPDIPIRVANFDAAPLIRVFFRLRNGQVIRVRARHRPLPATARCE